MQPRQSTIKRPSLLGPSMLAVMALTLGSASHAEPPPESTGKEQPKAAKKIVVPPLLKPVGCNDDNDLYKPCDKKFKVSCKKQKGEFYCDNPECTEGTCHLPEA